MISFCVVYIFLHRLKILYLLTRRYLSSALISGIVVVDCSYRINPEEDLHAFTRRVWVGALGTNRRKETFQKKIKKKIRFRSHYENPILRVQCVMYIYINIGIVYTLCYVHVYNIIYKAVTRKSPR